MKSAHIRDVISALRILTNYRDELAWMRYLKLWDGIGEVTATAIIEKLFSCNSLEECICMLKSSKLNNDSIYELLNNISNLESNPSKAIDVTVQALDKVLSHRYRNDNWEARKNDFSALKIVASKAESISSFITEYILDPIAELTEIDNQNDDKNNDFVIIYTIHSAKGLEADICYVANVNPGSYPSSRAIMGDEIEEERRCFYVALTRAKNELYLISYEKSNTAIKPQRIWQRKIVDINDTHITGILHKSKREYDKNGTVIRTSILYTLDNEPTITKEMEETKFWECYKAGDVEIKDYPYFLNNLPEYLVKKSVIYSEGNRSKSNHPKSHRFNNEFHDDMTDNWYQMDFS